MAKKLELINNAVVLYDTDTNEILGESPKRLVYYDAERLRRDSVIQIVNINPMENTHQFWPALPIGANVIDTGDAAYTIGSFQTFARTNLGF